jgi:hypothetical protein
MHPSNGFRHKTVGVMVVIGLSASTASILQTFAKCLEKGGKCPGGKGIILGGEFTDTKPLGYRVRFPSSKRPQVGDCGLNTGLALPRQASANLFRGGNSQDGKARYSGEKQRTPSR